MKKYIKNIINKFTHKDYIIKLEKLKGINYIDSDEILIHSIFQVIVDFIDKKNGRNKDWNIDEESRDAYECIMKAYNFWKYDYNEFQKDIKKAFKNWYKERLKNTLPPTTIIKNGIEYKQFEFKEPSELQRQLEIELNACRQMLKNKTDFHLYKIVKYKDYLWT
jgi:hypothetical protein